MAGLSHKWPMIIGLVGFMVVTALIWREIAVRDVGTSISDEDAYGIAFALLTFIWWGYYFVVALVTWLVASWLKSRAMWLLLCAPIVAIWFVNKTVQFASHDSGIGEIAFGLLVATAVAALPILAGASSHISEQILTLRNRRDAITGLTVFDQKE